MKKIIVCGPYNAGKTTFVRNVNSNEFLGTEEKEIDLETFTEKETTTTIGVEVNFYKNEGEELLFMGVPGQEKFDFIWEIVGQHFDGILFLYPAHESIERLKFYIDFFSKMDSFSTALKMILITHCEKVENIPLQKAEQFGFPVKFIDPRKKDQVLEVVSFVVNALKGEIHVRNP